MPDSARRCITDYIYDKESIVSISHILHEHLYFNMIAVQCKLSDWTKKKSLIINF